MADWLPHKREPAGRLPNSACLIAPLAHVALRAIAARKYEFAQRLMAENGADAANGSVCT